MKRYPAFDPPEYVSWTADPALVRAFRTAWASDPDRRRLIETLLPEEFLAFYRGLVRTRLHDIMLKRWVRQGVISKAWLGTGEEAATVGPVHALDRTRDVVAPMIRNAGACCEMGMSIADMLRGYLGTEDAPSRGRDGHVGSWSHRVLQPISHIGNMPPVAAGIALAARVTGTDPVVVLSWTGDGSVNAGATHEAFNFAAVQKLPCIFIIQNNQVALGTRTSAHRVPEDFSELHLAYGCRGWSFDGNNVLDAWAATRLAAEACRAGDGPVILAGETFRMGGHATHDEHEARVVLPPELFAYWGARDPIGLYEAFLVEEGFAEGRLRSIEEEAIAEVDAAADEALESKRDRMPAAEGAVDGVYAN